jgi:AraC family transcriptional regulator
MTPDLPLRFPAVNDAGAGRTPFRYDAIDTLGVAVERHHAERGIFHAPASPYHRVGLHVGAPVNAHCRYDGRSHRRVQSDGDLDVVPAGVDGSWEDDRACVIQRVWVNPALVRRVAEELELNPDRTLVVSQYQRRDPALAHLCHALASELDISAPGDRLYIESLARALATRLIRDAGPAQEKAALQRLSSIQKNRLVEFIEANLDQDLSLNELAQLVRLSVSHLKPLFRRTFGMPVHQYVILRRVERARDLLLAGALPPSQIALEAGFSHQSHMARSMQRVLGMTPGTLLRLRR